MIGYARNRRRYKESWLLGYRISTGIIEATDNPTDDNYIALACAILCNMSSKQALMLMDLAPEADIDYSNAKRNTIGQAVYILNTICCVSKKEISKIFNTDNSTLNLALRHAGIYKDSRCLPRKREE